MLLIDLFLGKEEEKVKSLRPEVLKEMFKTLDTVHASMTKNDYLDSTITRKTQLSVINFVYQTLKADKGRHTLAKFTPDFFESLDLPILIMSRVKEERELVMAFCELLTTSEELGLAMIDLV